MPVLVTAADRALARAVTTRLLATGGEVRAYTDEAVPSLRALGAFVATGELDDEGRLEAAMTGVHTVIHMGHGLLTADLRRAVRDVRTLVTAAHNAQVSRIIALSLTGVASANHDPLRAAFADIERLLAACSVPTIVVRSSLVVSDEVVDALATVGLTREALQTPVAAVSDADLASLVVALDDARSRATEGHLTLTAYGPHVTTLEDLLVRIGVVDVTDGVARFDVLGRRIVSEEVAASMSRAVTGLWIRPDRKANGDTAVIQATPQDHGEDESTDDAQPAPDLVDDDAAPDGFELMRLTPAAILR